MPEEFEDIELLKSMHDECYQSLARSGDAIAILFQLGNEEQDPWNREAIASAINDVKAMAETVRRDMRFIDRLQSRAMDLREARKVIIWP